MGKVRVNVASKETLSWPPFCVLCLKPDPKETEDLYSGDNVWRIPYCKKCYAKVTRFYHCGENLALFSAGWVGLIAGVLYLVNVVRQEGSEALLCLDKDVWGIALLVGIMAAFVIWLTIILTAGVMQPRLPSLFPSRFAKPGVDVVKSESHEEVTKPAPGVTQIETIEMNTLEFSNPKYAEKFRKANGLEEEK